MKPLKQIALIAVLLTMITGLVNAQVKIGDNPNSIDPNSILELESTDKGFLPPRVTLTSISSPSPLTAPVPAGMIVYNDGGALAEGHYTWNGASWMLINTKARDNYVIVKSAADFPTPAGGVITLSANTVYEINGAVSITNSINLNGSTIIGQNKLSDQLVYTAGSGELFTGNGGGNIRSLTITSTSPGAQVFNINAGNDPTSSLSVEFTYIFNCGRVGTLTGFGTVGFQSIAFSNNTYGIVLNNIGSYISINEYWFADNKNTYQTFTGAFDEIQIDGGERHTLSVFSAKALDISGLTSISEGAYISNTFFTGDGVKVVGTFSSMWEVEANGLNTEKDGSASGNLYISSVVTTTFTSANTPVKILGGTTAVSLYRVGAPANNRLTYTGSKSRRFSVICSLSAVAAGNSKNFSFYIVKNGTILNESKQLMKCSSQVDRGSITLSCTVLLNSNDYVEVWVANNSDATAVTIESMNLAIR
jgi:hypothetical protein